MVGKPQECLTVERSIQYKEGDIYIVTFPKTGTTFLQYLCYLIRIKAETEDPRHQFEDIHQVCPHTSSAWCVKQSFLLSY
jgi:hypothetical protein